MLELHFLRYREIEELSSKQRTRKIIDLVKDNKIVLLEGRLSRQEETDMIGDVMKQISTKFKGVELAVIDPDTTEGSIFMKVRKVVATWLLGNRTGFTIIGPASIIKEIKRDPSKIELYADNARKRRK